MAESVIKIEPISTDTSLRTGITLKRYGKMRILYVLSDSGFGDNLYLSESDRPPLTFTFMMFMISGNTFFPAYGTINSNGHISGRYWSPGTDGTQDVATRKIRGEAVWFVE